VNIERLHEFLTRAGVPEDAYSLRGGTNWNGRYCIDSEGNSWVVYFAENGLRSRLSTFEAEAEACEALFAWLKRDLGLAETE